MSVLVQRPQWLRRRDRISRDRKYQIEIDLLEDTVVPIMSKPTAITSNRSSPTSIAFNFDGPMPELMMLPGSWQVVGKKGKVLKSTENMYQAPTILNLPKKKNPKKNHKKQVEDEENVMTYLDTLAALPSTSRCVHELDLSMLQHEKLAMHGISLKKWARHRREKQATQQVHVPADPPKKKVAAPEPEAYIVDKVIDVKMEGKDKLYLVQWKGFSAMHNTWESISNLEERQQMGGRRLSRDGDKSTRDSLVYVLPNERLLVDRLRWAADLSPDVPSRAPVPPKIKRDPKHNTKWEKMRRKVRQASQSSRAYWPADDDESNIEPEVQAKEPSTSVKKSTRKKKVIEVPRSYADVVRNASSSFTASFAADLPSASLQTQAAGKHKATKEPDDSNEWKYSKAAASCSIA